MHTKAVLSIFTQAYFRLPNWSNESYCLGLDSVLSLIICGILILGNSGRFLLRSCCAPTAVAFYYYAITRIMETFVFSLTDRLFLFLSLAKWEIPILLSCFIVSAWHTPWHSGCLSIFVYFPYGNQVQVCTYICAPITRLVASSLPGCLWLRVRKIILPLIDIYISITSTTWHIASKSCSLGNFSPLP